MNTLIRHIEYLISRKDCVIIPDFGALLATHVSARYDSMSHVFMPPHRLITFNGDLRHNDGMLVTSVQRAEGIGYESAMRRVRAAVDAMQLTLTHKGSLSLGAVGTITRDAGDGTVTFTASEIDCLSVSSIWFEPISIHEVGGTTVETPAIRRQYSPWLRIVRTAAAIALLVGIGFVTTTPIAVDQDTMLASLAPEISKVKATDLLPAQDEVRALDAPAPEIAVDEVIAVSNGPTYYVIVASFATEAEALKFVSYHPDQTLKILDQGRYYKVYASAHSDVYEAYRASNCADKQYPGAWVCKIDE